MPITRELRAPQRPPVDHDLTRLTLAERLFIWRHRQPTPEVRPTDRFGRSGRAGSEMSQAEAADLIGISRSTYSKLEHGQRSLLSLDDVEMLIPALRHLEPTTRELCFIARRRSGNLLSTLERELGISRPRFHELERAGDQRLVQAWLNRGFVFPDAIAKKASAA